MENEKKTLKENYRDLKYVLSQLLDDVDISFISTYEQQEKPLTKKTIQEILSFYKIKKFEHIEKMLQVIDDIKMPFLESEARNRAKLNTLVEEVSCYITITNQQQEKQYKLLYDFILDHITNKERVKRDDVIRFIVELGVVNNLRFAEDIYHIFGYCFATNDWYDCALKYFIEERYAEKTCREESVILNNQQKYELILKNIIFDNQFKEKLYDIADSMNTFYTSIDKIFEVISNQNSIDFIDFKEKCSTNNKQKIAKYLYNYISGYGLNLKKFDIEEETITEIVKNSSENPSEILTKIKRGIKQKANRNRIISDKTIILYLLASKREELQKDGSYSKMYEAFYPWESRTNPDVNMWVKMEDEELSKDLINYVVFIYLFSDKELNKKGTGYRSIMDNIDKASVIGYMKKIFLQKLWVNKLYKYDVLTTKIMKNSPTEEAFIEFYSPIIQNIFNELREGKLCDASLRKYYDLHIKRLEILSQNDKLQKARLASIYQEICVKKLKGKSKKGGSE